VLITDVLLPGQEEDLLDALDRTSGGYRGDQIVVVGERTGLSNLLRGLKHYSANITAIVTVADDGGSSGAITSGNWCSSPGTSQLFVSPGRRGKAVDRLEIAV
jgi:hypothetical protein